LPNQTSTGSFTPITARVTQPILEWLQGLSAEQGVSLMEVMRRVFDDARTFHGLPLAITSELDADREALGLGRRDYVAHVLALRANQVRDSGPGFEAARKSKKK
jgi:hypothetical protein